MVGLAVRNWLAGLPGNASLTKGNGWTRFPDGVEPECELEAPRRSLKRGLPGEVALIRIGNVAVFDVALERLQESDL